MVMGAVSVAGAAERGRPDGEQGVEPAHDVIARVTAPIDGEVVP